jgi:indole-3-acetate monooxygenase
MRLVTEMVQEIEVRRTELDATARDAEAFRTAPPALVNLLRELRVSMTKVPTVLGGDELTPADQLRYFEALAYANPTAGWIGFVHAGATGMVGARLPEQGISEVFGGDQPPCCAAVAAASGKRRPVEGGFTVTGRWAYASGARHSDWVLVHTTDPSDDSAPRGVVVPAPSVILEDDWHSMSQQGTGSVDIVLDDVFVPEHLVLEPGPHARRGGPLYDSARSLTYIAGENCGFTLGVSQRFLDEIAVYATTKSRGGNGTLAGRGAFRYELGRAQMQVRAARALMGETLTRSWDAYLAERSPSPEGEIQTAATLAYATESATDAVTRLFHFAGAGALHDSNPLQRCFRDVHGSAQHRLASNVAYERLAALILTNVG